MFHRLLYALVLVAVLFAAWLKGGAYLHEVHLGQAGTPAGLLDLGYVLAMVSAAIIAVRTLLRSKSSHRIPQGHADQARTAEGQAVLPVQRIRTTVRGAFSTRPVSASLLLLFLFSIPVCLAAFSVGGLRLLSPENWILVGISELPISVVTIIALWKGTPSR